MWGGRGYPERGYPLNTWPVGIPATNTGAVVNQVAEVPAPWVDDGSGVVVDDYLTMDLIIVHAQKRRRR